MQSPACRADARGPTSLTAERGSILFEAIVSMVLLVIFALGFLAAVDTASQISGNNEARSAPPPRSHRRTSSASRR